MRQRNPEDPIPPMPRRQGSPQSFGMQRRPDLDKPGVQVWEAPDGRVYAWRADEKPWVFGPNFTKKDPEGWP